MIVLKSDAYQMQSIFLSLGITGTVVTLELYELNAGAKIAESVEDFDISNYGVASQQTFDLAQIFRAYSRFCVLIDKMGNLMAVADLDALSNSRDGFSGIQFLQQAGDQFALALYFHDTAADYVMATFIPTMTTSTYTVKAQSETFGQMIMAVIPAAENVLNINKAKAALLLGVDPNSSLAGLEAQVDLLTNLVFLLLEAQTPAIQQQISTEFPELSSFQAACSANSVTTVKSAANCVTKLTNVKALVRQLQKTYYGVVAQNPIT